MTIPKENEYFIKQHAKDHIPVHNEIIYWSLHAVKKIRVEGLRKAEVENSLKGCIIIEDYPLEGRPLPDCLVLGYVGANPIHIVVAIDRGFDRIIIVMVYRPSLTRWENDWKRRKN